MVTTSKRILVALVLAILLLVPVTAVAGPLVYDAETPGGGVNMPAPTYRICCEVAAKTYLTAQQIQPPTLTARLNAINAIRASQVVRLDGYMRPDPIIVRNWPGGYPAGGVRSVR